VGDGEARKKAQVLTADDQRACVWRVIYSGCRKQCGCRKRPPRSAAATRAGERSQRNLCVQKGLNPKPQVHKPDLSYRGGRLRGWSGKDLRGTAIVVVRAKASDFRDGGKSGSLDRQKSSGSG
jgi:hypothetical protein